MPICRRPNWCSSASLSPILLTQMLWGLSWNFASGADVAWISDELDDPATVAVVLVRAEQAQPTGTVAGSFGRVYPLKLVDVPVDPVLWLAALGVLMSLLGAAALRLVRPHVNGAGTMRRGFLITCLVAVAGVIALAVAPDDYSGSLAVVLAAGGLPLTRSFTTIWINQQTVSVVRATVHSLLAQAKYLGEIACGLALAAVAHLASLSVALLTCGGLLMIAVLIVRPLRTGRSRPRPGR